MARALRPLIAEAPGLVLVTTFGGYDLIMRAYREAIVERYRLFSYGDTMLIVKPDSERMMLPEVSTDKVSQKVLLQPLGSETVRHKL